MKKFTKLFSALTLALLLALTMGLSVGCSNNDNNSWDGRTYNISVYLSDGTTPVEGIRLALCYNTETSSTCLLPVKTGPDGKATIVIPEGTTFVGNPVIHFHNDKDIPEGYAHPENMSKITMVDGSVYEHALALNAKETKLILTKLS